MSHDPIGLALAEDIGSGDVTSASFVAAAARGTARIVAREKAVVAGVETAAEVFTRVEAKLQVAIVRASGASVAPGDVVLEIQGAIRAILTAERVALNFLQRLSGVATLTRHFVEAVAGTPAKILDTRKTTPGLRAFEKAAVRAGGGENHRFGLFDMAMVKDNHLAARDRATTLRDDLDRFRRDHPGLRLELEADTLDQVREFLDLGGADVILLDNMTPAQLRAAVALRKGGVLFEASGGVTLETAREIAGTGVDYISVGALTHSARAIDYSLELRPTDVSP